MKLDRLADCALPHLATLATAGVRPLADQGAIRGADGDCVASLSSRLSSFLTFRSNQVIPTNANAKVIALNKDKKTIASFDTRKKVQKSFTGASYVR